MLSYCQRLGVDVKGEFPIYDEVYTPENIVEMSARLASVINRLDAGARARFGKVSLPRRVNLTTVQEGVEQ